MKVQIIEGSIREGRLGERVAKWVATEAEKRSGFEVELVRLVDYQLPLYDLPLVPEGLHDPYENAIARSWTDKIESADAYIVVTGEYNHSIPGALKNALDYLYPEVGGKPGGIVSYSTGIVGGARSAEHLALVMLNMKIVPLSVKVAIGRADKTIDEGGRLQSEGPDKALAALFDQLEGYGKALEGLR